MKQETGWEGRQSPGPQRTGPALVCPLIPRLPWTQSGIEGGAVSHRFSHQGSTARDCGVKAG